MTRFLQALVQALLASVALAAPGLDKKSPCKRAPCNADNCLRAVRATALPRPANASADCASFLRKTVSPCPTTTTTTLAGTITGPASTLTVSQFEQVASTAIQTEILTSITTTTRVINVTVTNVVNQPQTKTVAVTAAAVGRREPVPASLSSDAGSTCAATVGASAVPTYASACSGAVRYSSACSCYGVTASTVTAAQSTSTATATSVDIITPTITVTARQTQFSVITAVRTQIIQSTTTTYSFRTVATVAVTFHPEVTVTQTVTPTTSCSTYAPYATNGAYAGDALQRNGAGVFAFGPGMGDPQLLTIQTDGYLHDPSRLNFVAAIRNPSKSVVIFVDPSSSSNQGWTPLKCRVGDPLNQSGIFPLYCDGGTFETCGDNTLYFVSSVSQECTVANLGVFKACTTPYN